MKSALTDREIEELLARGTPFIDVRAPVEFEHGSVPGAVNLPLLNDEERAAVGTTYKHDGQDAAIALGHKLLSGETRRARLEAWADFARANPSAWVYCFRGGLRSQSVQAALGEMGVEIPLVSGGYKRVRQILLDTIERACGTEPFAVISGFTGSGKTDLLVELSASGARVCDLEAAANHRGSSFGKLPSSQPSQVDFENGLAVDLIRAERLSEKTEAPILPILLEDESRKVGRCEIPASLFARLSTSPVYVIDRPIEERARYLTELYVSENYGLKEGDKEADSPDTAERFARFRHDVNLSLLGIARRLGGTDLKKFNEMTLAALNEHAHTGAFAVHYEWVEKILERYYDPMYGYHLGKITDRIVFRGSADEVRAKLLGA